MTISNRDTLVALLAATDQRFIDMVYEYPSGCESGKENFLHYVGLKKLCNKIFTISCEIEIDKETLQDWMNDESTALQNIEEQMCGEFGESQVRNFKILNEVDA